MSNSLANHRLVYLHRSLICLFLILFFLALCPPLVMAQFTVTIGSSQLTNQRYACRSFPGGQDILVTKGEKTKKISKKRAKAIVKKSLGSAARRIKNIRSTLKDKKKALKKIENSVKFVLPKYAERARKLRNEVIPKLEGRIVMLEALKSELQFIRLGIKRCGTTALFSGSNQLFTGNENGPVTGDQYYLLASRHVFTFSGSIPQDICAEIDGMVTTVRWSQFACCNAFDGTGTSNPFSFCADVNLSPNQGLVGLGGACDKFSSGRFDQNLATATDALSKIVRVFLPDATGRCSS